MKKSLKKVLLAAVICAASLQIASFARADVTIATSGKSTFTIIIPQNSPLALQNAAQELQKDIEIATGAKLVLQTDDAAVNTPVISLGNTAQAKSNGISSADMADDSYRIVTKDNNVYILGVDTPDDQKNVFGGVSRGTPNGIYTFLEDYLDVRWLMPGDLGRDVPRKSTFTLPDINRTETPPLHFRYMGHIYDQADSKSQPAAAREWQSRLRIGFNVDQPVQVAHGHNWWRTINRAFGGKNEANPNTEAVRTLYKQHPEWFAMNSKGERPLPKSHYEKLETTNQGLVRWFAEQAIKEMKEAKYRTPFSLSPSDGGRWSESPESKALYDPPLPTLGDSEGSDGKPGMSSLVLKWYHDIAQIVQREYPQGRLGGYIYASYFYPPTKFSMKLPENFTPTIAPSISYGYGLYHPETQQRFNETMDAWAKVIDKDWYYYDLPNIFLRNAVTDIGDRKTADFPGSTGIIVTPAPGILNMISDAWLRNHIRGAILYGSASWSSTALTNYMLAKKEWEPLRDAYDVQREWLERAYGKAAGQLMNQLYLKLDDWTREYYLQNLRQRYEVTYDLLQNLYAKRYPEMEQMFLQAKQQEMTPVQKQRLQLIENNLVVLQWRLRNAGFLQNGFASPLQRSNEEINELLTRDNADFALFPGAVRRDGWQNARFRWKVELAKTLPDVPEKSTFPDVKDDTYLLYAAQDGDIRIKTDLVMHGAYFAAYQLRNQKGELLQSGLLDEEKPLIIPAKKGDSYYLTIPPRKPVNYKLTVQNARLAEGHFDGRTLALRDENAPVYVYVLNPGISSGALEGDGGITLKKPFSGMEIKEKLLKSGSYEKDVKVIASLDEDWSFAPDPNNDGEKRGVLKADFDDGNWAKITALNWWQFQGFPDYRGVAWYRKKFHVNADAIPKGKTRYLYFGAIDGNAEIYLNGEKIREHLLEPDGTGWNKPFGTYNLSGLNAGENMLVVKVTSKPVGSSGIFKGVSLLTGTRVKKD